MKRRFFLKTLFFAPIFFRAERVFAYAQYLPMLEETQKFIEQYLKLPAKLAILAMEAKDLINMKFFEQLLEPPERLRQIYHIVDEFVDNGIRTVDEVKSFVQDMRSIEFVEDFKTLSYHKMLKGSEDFIGWHKTWVERFQGWNNNLRLAAMTGAAEMRRKDEFDVHYGTLRSMVEGSNQSLLEENQLKLAFQDMLHEANVQFSQYNAALSAYLHTESMRNDLRRQISEHGFAGKEALLESENEEPTTLKPYLNIR